jgi:hypothetical protein
MAQLVTEVAQGQSFRFDTGQDGAPTQSQSRVFKVLLSSPGEVVNLQLTCGVLIGDRHPYNPGIYCQSFGAQFDGESRMVIVATFQYGSFTTSSNGNQEQPPQSPDIQPANWSLSSSLMEVPVRTWRRRTGFVAWAGFRPAANSVDDIYDGITKMAPVVTISITQFDALDPTRHAEHVGKINSRPITLGSLVMKPHTVMFRGLNVQSQVKPWGEGQVRGWESVYEFAYRENETGVSLVRPATGGDVVYDLIPLGWDIAVPDSGWNVKAFDPTTATQFEDAFGQPLKHDNLKIVTAPALALPDGVTAGDKVRAMVKVFEYKGGGASQTPSASPVALNPDGRPRKVGNDPYVYAYAVHEEFDITSVLGLRLF